jgi:hypothetical protein
MAVSRRPSPEVVSDYLASLDWVYWKDDVWFRDGVGLADIEDVWGQVCLDTGLWLGEKTLGGLLGSKSRLVFLLLG